MIKKIILKNKTYFLFQIIIHLLTVFQLILFCYFPDGNHLFWLCLNIRLSIYNFIRAFNFITTEKEHIKIMSERIVCSKFVPIKPLLPDKN
jgi:hypothetical protein